MKTTVRKALKWGLPGFLILLVLLFRRNPGWSEWYAGTVYPGLSAGLSAFSSLFPFSVGDCFIVLSIAGLLVYPCYAWRKKKGFFRTSLNMVRFLMWIYIWFYLAWGINYFRLPFYERSGVREVTYSAVDFQYFLDDYINHLNKSYEITREEKGEDWFTGVSAETAFRIQVPEMICAAYRKLDDRFGLCVPPEQLFPKTMLCSKAMSMVGVTGYMGPFFSEFNLNRELWNAAYPFTYAHELAHRLGIAGEAEANLYAFMTTTQSSHSEMQFSGYFSLLGYVMKNARQLLTEEQYRENAGRISADILNLYHQQGEYWRQKYHPWIGKWQHRLYNAYLKNQNIHSGTRNYSEVVGLAIAVWKSSAGESGQIE